MLTRLERLLRGHRAGHEIESEVRLILDSTGKVEPAMRLVEKFRPRLAEKITDNLADEYD